MSTSKPSLPPMEPIRKLAVHLRQRGDQVLNGTSKLALDTNILHDLNQAFASIVDDSRDLESSFQVCNSSEIDVFQDLKFLHDFVQKTIWLKVMHTQDQPAVKIDITKFRHLKNLELQKIDISLVTGIQSVRGQLESIACSGGCGVAGVDQLLKSCGGDGGVGFIWPSLRRLTISYNAIKDLGISLELVPWVQTLDFSNNFIICPAGVEHLSNLKHVNFGYNRLEVVPRFNKETCKTLVKLVLTNNYLDRLTGIEVLKCLTDLDVSYNCLVDHVCLWALESITTLISLNCQGNPISYHKNHRALTLKHLNINLAKDQFILDRVPLTKTEKMILSETRTFTIPPSSSSRRHRARPSTSSETSGLNISARGSIETTTSPCETTSQVSDPSIDKSSSTIKKQQNVSEAVITDDEIVKSDQPEAPSSSLQASMEHLETKKQILAVREQYGGDRWLTSDAGGYVQQIMGIERTSELVSPSTSIADLSTVISDLEDIEKSVISPENEENASGPVQYEEKDEFNEQLNYVRKAISGISKDHKREIDEQIGTGWKESSYDPEAETGQLFLVQKRRDYDDQLEEVFLVITSDDIKERETITGRVISRWSTDTILSCVMGKGMCPTIDFTFNAIRRDRQNRMYLVDSDDAGRIVETVTELIQTRPIMLKVFKCMKCSTHFSQDFDSYLSLGTMPGIEAKSLTCPTCKSTLVIHIDELSDKDDNQEVKDIKSDLKALDKEKTEVLKDLDENVDNLRFSASHSSIGGTEGGAMFATTSTVHSDSQPQAQVSCKLSATSSATSLDDSRESTPSTSTLVKKYESDIEVLSNPSQSSIEVLDDGTKSASTANRSKRSSEERRIAVAPTLLTIPDTTPVKAGLPESSSSGSLTDSICTAHENKDVKATKSMSESENAFAAAKAELAQSLAPNLSSILEDVLQNMSTKADANKDSSPKVDAVPAFPTGPIQYSYTDFTKVDHRIKLHLILSIFEQGNEKLILFLLADILLRTQPRPFLGCLVITTTNIYILKIRGPMTEEPQRWLHKEASWPINRLRTITPLPFKQGSIVQLQLPSKTGEDVNYMVLCFLQDYRRTSNFMCCVNEMTFPTSCKVDFTVPSHCLQLIQNLMISSKYKQEGDEIKTLAVFSSAFLQLGRCQIRFRMGSLLVTSSAVILIKDRLHWLIPDGQELPDMLIEQPISNVVELMFKEETIALKVLDEVAGHEDIWTLNFVSGAASRAVIEAIRTPWENIFSIPFHITLVKDARSVKKKT